MKSVKSSKKLVRKEIENSKIACKTPFCMENSPSKFSDCPNLIKTDPKKLITKI